MPVAGVPAVATCPWRQRQSRRRPRRSPPPNQRASRPLLNRGSLQCQYRIPKGHRISPILASEYPISPRPISLHPPAPSFELGKRQPYRCRRDEMWTQGSSAAGALTKLSVTLEVEERFHRTENVRWKTASSLRDGKTPSPRSK